VTVFLCYIAGVNHVTVFLCYIAGVNHVTVFLCYIAGVSYGKGCYFSTSSEYSSCYSPSNFDKYIILAQVATGRYQLGNSSTDRSNLPESFHSTVNKLDSPTIFVVYHDAAAYPTYVIKFSLTPNYLAG